MAARGFLGAGDLYVERFDPVAKQYLGKVGPYEIGKFEIKANVEAKEMLSKGKDTYGQVVESVMIPKSTDFAVEMREVNTESMTMAMLGTVKDLTQAAGTISAEHVFLKVGVWTPLNHINLSETGFTVADTGGLTTYDLGVDFEINWMNGWIRPIEGSALYLAAETAGATGEEVVINGSYNALDGVQIEGATNTQIRARLTFDGKNFADDAPCIVECYEAIIAPDQAFDYLADDFNTVVLKGKLKTPKGLKTPFVVKLPTAGA